MATTNVNHDCPCAKRDHAKCACKADGKGCGCAPRSGCDACGCDGCACCSRKD